MTLRVKNSIELLESGKSVTEAATTSGFFDSSYYAKVFKRYIGYTPKEYLEKIRYRDFYFSFHFARFRVWKVP